MDDSDDLQEVLAKLSAHLGLGAVDVSDLRKPIEVPCNDAWKKRGDVDLQRELHVAVLTPVGQEDPQTDMFWHTYHVIGHTNPEMIWGGRDGRPDVLDAVVERAFLKAVTKYPNDDPRDDRIKDEVLAFLGKQGYQYLGPAKLISTV